MPVVAHVQKPAQHQPPSVRRRWVFEEGLQATQVIKQAHREVRIARIAVRMPPLSVFLYFYEFDFVLTLR